MRTLSIGALGCLALSALVQAGSVPNPPTNDEYVRFAMAHDGNSEQGKRILADVPRLACAQCHTTDGSSKKAGPDLFAAGDSFPRRELIRSILEPSAIIAVGYATTEVETKSGEEYAGIIKQATGEWIELMSADGRLVRISASEIKKQRTSNTSLMPPNLQVALSLQEFTDLVEYLVSLKQPASAASSTQGTPDTIPLLARPIALHPFFSETFRFPHASGQLPGELRIGPVWFEQGPGLSNAFVVVHQSGKIWLMEKHASGESKALFADISGEVFSLRGPNGLLGLAFHPKFTANHKYYLKHQVLEDGRIATVVVERQAAADFRSDSGQPSRRLIKIVGATQDHGGGCIRFGPDGYLYIGMGDTGPQQDPQGHGQDMKALWGKMARIDVDRLEGDQPYGIPADNPFRARADVRPEIWASGLREPWRFSFDSVTGDLWVGDVGQDRVEEVAIVRRGENHGWNVIEGFEPFSSLYRKEGSTYVPPVFAYKRKYGNSITGGYVYRANPRSSFYGVYICGDYTSKRIWGLTQENRTLKAIRQIGTSPESIVSFAADAQGELYLVGYEGMVYKLDFSDAVFE